ncbi:MAG: dihydrodipicolinate synthase family protein [Oscillospiraceae bacterium]|nr:dihydrodipicolinate synthase family protein [Oscillospiraceae bacterium]
MNKGFYTALGTPMNADGTFCAAGMAAQIEQQIAAGASGLLVMGSMGVQPYIKDSEYPKVAECAAEAAKGRVPVLVGVTDVSIARVQDRMDAISHVKGIDGIVSTVPYYGALNQDGVYNFYNAIANASKWGTYLYDLAVVTKTATSADTVKKLWKNDNIKGIKSGNLVTLRQLFVAEDRPADFTMMFSNIDEFDIAYKYGIDKNLDGMFACTPKTARKMYDALEAGDQAAAAKHLNAILGLRDFFLTTSSLMSAFSHCMNLLGCEGDFCGARDYETKVSDAEKEKITAAFKALGEI